MRELSFTVSGTPIAKGRPRFSMRGGVPRAYTPDRTDAWEEQIAWAAKSAGALPSDSPCRVMFIATFVVPASWGKKKALDALQGHRKYAIRPDIDNLYKCLDALNGIAWKDDAQVYSIMAEKRYGLDPGLSVTIVYDA